MPALHMCQLVRNHIVYFPIGEVLGQVVGKGDAIEGARESIGQMALSLRDDVNRSKSSTRPPRDRKSPVAQFA